MNIFDELKIEMAKKYPLLKEQPFIFRLKSLFLGIDGEYTLTKESPNGAYSQSAITTTLNGKEYIKRWGALK